MSKKQAIWLIGIITLVAAFLLRPLSGITHAASVTIDTKLLQRDLAGLSYLPMSGIDGLSGPQTRDAVLTFQSDNTLQMDGIAGPQTMGALESKVEVVQQIAGTSADGDYGPLTIAAVKHYQYEHHLQVDGIAGPQTMTLMRIPRKVGGGSSGETRRGSANRPTLSGNTSEKIVEAADSQLGIHEWGNNCNPYGPCEDWCALFASWTWQQAGIDISTAFSGDFYWFGKSHRTLHRGYSDPQPGDAILFGTGPQSTSTSWHVGIIVQVLSNGEVISMEGNYGNQVAKVGPYWPSGNGRPDNYPVYAIVSP